MSAIRLDLREIDEWRVVPISTAHADLLAASEAVAVRPFGRGTWQVRANSWVGAAVLGESGGVQIDLRVEPKVAIERLLFLLSYSAKDKGWREELVETPVAADVPSAIAHSLARLTDQAMRQGVLQGYRTVEESGLTLRGRLREKDQILRRFGAALPVEVVYDDFGPDIAENQILKAALWRMLAVPGVDPLVLRRLTKLRHRLGEVTDLAGGQALPHWRRSRLNARYVSALLLAELILRSSSFELGRGAIPATGFLVSMPIVFENFVATALTDAMEKRFGGRCSSQDTGWHLDSGKQISLRPDLVWYPSSSRAGTSPGVVADAKYKAESPSGFPNADVYQLLAYCSAMKLSVGHLIYAKGNEPQQNYFLPGTGPAGRGVAVYAHALDLDKAPPELIAQVEHLAEKLMSFRMTPMEVHRG
jgi:5-methylcytosine-specific restriction enzyme subunit McrC